MKLSSLLQAGLNRKTLLPTIADDVVGEVAEGLKSQLNLSNEILILDAGGGRQGRGSGEEFLSCLAHQNNKKVISMNIEKSMLPHVLADLSKPWPFQAGTLDLIVSTWVLEHLANPEFFIQEAYRALKPGGWLVLSTPFLYHKHAFPRDYFRFTDDSLRHLLSIYDFEVVDIRPIGRGPFLACLSLAWPIARPFGIFPILSFSLLGLAYNAPYQCRE